MGIKSAREYAESLVQGRDGWHLKCEHLLQFAIELEREEDGAKVSASEEEYLKWKKWWAENSEEPKKKDALTEKPHKICFKAWDKENKKWFDEVFLNQIFLRQDGKVYWRSADGMKDETDKISIFMDVVEEPKKITRKELAEKLYAWSENESRATAFLDGDAEEVIDFLAKSGYLRGVE